MLIDIFMLAVSSSHKSLYSSNEVSCFVFFTGIFRPVEKSPKLDIVLVWKMTMHRNVGFWFVVVHHPLSSFFAALRVK